MKGTEDLSIMATAIVSFPDNISGHKEFSVEVDFEYEELHPIMVEVENWYNTNTHCKGMVYLQIFADKSGSMLISDFWKEGEHSLGHKDKLLFSWGSV